MRLANSISQFVTLMLTVLPPIQCLLIPNGATVMTPLPSLVCWQSMYTNMAALGFCGVVFDQVCIFSVVAWVTWHPGRW